MEEKKFSHLATVPGCPGWEILSARAASLYERDTMRDCFERDYTRILHSSAFRRLKHKTQVFPHVENDHICTRMEHVLHVESVSGVIAESLGLSTHLTRAIAMGHDLGHAPFGHQGEQVLNRISLDTLGVRFWHEQNGLHFVEDIELLEDPWRVEHNLDLTYAVRDGILSHCGEVDESSIRPRTEYIDLSDFDSPGAYQSATWEGCVVKLADKIQLGIIISCNSHIKPTECGKTFASVCNNRTEIVVKKHVHPLSWGVGIGDCIGFAVFRKVSEFF